MKTVKMSWAKCLSDRVTDDIGGEVSEFTEEKGDGKFQPTSDSESKAVDVGELMTIESKGTIRLTPVHISDSGVGGAPACGGFVGSGLGP